MNFEHKLKLATNFCLTDKTTVSYIREELIPLLQEYNADSDRFNKIYLDEGMEPLCPLDVAKGKIALRVAQSRLKLVKGLSNV